MKQIVVAMTGASGAAYGLRLIQRLASAGVKQHLLFSDAARVVLKQEIDLVLPEKPEQIAKALATHLNISPDLLNSYHLSDWFSPVASGSAGIRHMVVIPCSMGSLARIAGGISDNLLERAADVMLKERGHLILVPRETPLSSIHLEHMLKLSNMGVEMIPAMPGFYHRPESVDDLVNFVVDRVMDRLGIDDGEANRWGG
jgi:4-hydroxy-3-polyprenylbenzoate decarboxylase